MYLVTHQAVTASALHRGEACLGIAFYVMLQSYLGSRASGHTMISAWITEGKGRRATYPNRNFAGPLKKTTPQSKALPLLM